MKQTNTNTRTHTTPRNLHSTMLRNNSSNSNSSSSKPDEEGVCSSAATAATTTVVRGRKIGTTSQGTTACVAVTPTSIRSMSNDSCFTSETNQSWPTALQSQNSAAPSSHAASADHTYTSFLFNTAASKKYSSDMLSDEASSCSTTASSQHHPHRDDNTNNRAFQHPLIYSAPTTDTLGEDNSHYPSMFPPLARPYMVQTPTRYRRPFERPATSSLSSSSSVATTSVPAHSSPFVSSTGTTSLASLQQKPPKKTSTVGNIGGSGNHCFPTGAGCSATSLCSSSSSSNLLAEETTAGTAGTSGPSVSASGTTAAPSMSLMMQAAAAAAATSLSSLSKPNHPQERSVSGASTASTQAVRNITKTPQAFHSRSNTPLKQNYQSSNSTNPNQAAASSSTRGATAASHPLKQHSERSLRSTRRRRHHRNRRGENARNRPRGDFQHVEDYCTVAVRAVSLAQRSAFEARPAVSLAEWHRVAAHASATAAFLSQGKFHTITSKGGGSQANSSTASSTSSMVSMADTTIATASVYKRMSPSLQHLKLLHQMQAKTVVRQLDFSPSTGLDSDLFLGAAELWNASMGGDRQQKLAKFQSYYQQLFDDGRYRSIDPVAATVATTVPFHMFR